MRLGTSSTFSRPRIDFEQFLYLFWGQVLTTTRVIASSSGPLLRVDTINVLFDLVRSLVSLGPRYCAGSVPEKPIPLGEIVCARHWNWFSLPDDEGGPIFIYIRVSGDCEGQVKER